MPETIMPLEDVKAHLRVDFADDDQQITRMRDAACEMVEGWTGPIADLAAEVPPSIREAILMLVGHWYEQRGAASEAAMVEVPFGFHDLIARHRKWEF
ncbi:head-tail connector protein [Xanthobacteraceae bacterium A53D]